MANQATDNVTYIISIEAAEAVQQLEALNAQTSSWDAKISQVTAKVQQLSAQWGTSFRSTIGVLKNADAEMQQASNSAGIFGLQVTNAATGATKSLSNIGFAQVAKEAEDASPRAVRSIDAMRIALGALTAMLVFNVVQAFQNFFSGAIKNAMDLQGALYNVANAERIMSEQGIDITPKGLQKMANELKALVPIMSQIDATKAISSLALFTKDLGYTKSQIDELSKAVGVLYVRNQAMGLSFEQVLSQVQTGLLTGRAQGIRDLGVSISESAIQQEALRLGLVKTDKEFQNLTGDIQTQVKAQAMLSIIVRNTSKEQADLGKYMETDSGKMKTFSASIEDFKTRTGQAFLPILGVLAQLGSKILDVNTAFQKLFAFFDVSAITQIVAPFVIIDQALKGNIHSVEDIDKVYASVFSKVNNWVQLHTGLILQQADATDTATTASKNLGSALLDMSKVDMSSFVDSLVSMGNRLSQLDRDFSQQQANYQDEYNTKISRMQQDYQTEVAKTIQDFNDKRASAEQTYRNNQIDAEAKFQEQMRELRAKYLFDLEDALRNRDARQVLRLQAQFKMDKDNLQHNYDIENASRARQYQKEMADLRKQEAEKLQELASAEKIKEQRAAEDFAREQAQRQQRYENEKADLIKQMDDKLHEEAAKLAEELGLRQGSADDIYNLLKKYYGPQGLFDGLYDYSYNSLVSRTSQMLAALQGLAAQGMATATELSGAFVGSTNTGSYRGGGGTTGGIVGSTNSGDYRGGGGTTQTTPIISPVSNKRAKGGIDYVTSPTTVTYGEAGPEWAIFLPQGRSLAEVPNNVGGGTPPGLEGHVTVALDVSPDLEARITENTLNQAADAVTITYRRRR